LSTATTFSIITELRLSLLGGLPCEHGVEGEVRTHFIREAVGPAEVGTAGINLPKAALPRDKLSEKYRSQPEPVRCTGGVPGCSTERQSEMAFV
jgi:hypothetical protein